MKNILLPVFIYSKSYGFRDSETMNALCSFLTCLCKILVNAYMDTETRIWAFI